MKKFFKVFFLIFSGFIAGIIYDQIFLKEKYDIKKINEKYSFNDLKKIYNAQKNEIKKIILKELPVLINKINYDKIELNKIADDREKYVRKALIVNIQSYLGKRYVYSGTDPEYGFDCSGLVYHSFKEIGISVPRTAREQFLKSKKKKSSDIKIGDLVFFEVYPDDNLINSFRNFTANFIKTQVKHVGIYIGDGKFIHSPREGKNVMISDLNNSYWRNHLIGVGDYITGNVNTVYNYLEKNIEQKQEENKKIIEKIELEPIFLENSENEEKKDLDADEIEE